MFFFIHLLNMHVTSMCGCINNYGGEGVVWVLGIMVSHKLTTVPFKAS